MSRSCSTSAPSNSANSVRPHTRGVLQLLVAVIGALAAVAHAQLTLLPPVLLGPPGLTSLGQGGITVARAANGRVLAVWSDNRTGDHDIYGALFTPNGALIGFPNGFKIAGSPGTNEGDPRVAACGNRFLVVWGNGIGDGDTTDLFATRVNTNGVVLDSSPIVISNQPGVQHNQRQPSSDDVDTFIVPFRTASDSIYGGINIMRVKASTGATLDPPGGVVVAKGVDAQGLKKNASTSFGAGMFLVTWDDERDRAAYPGEGIDIFGAFIDPATGSMIGQPFATTRAYSCQEGSRSAFDGVNFLIAHSDERLTNCVTADVYAERVTPAGAVLDQVDPTGMIGGLAIASDPNGYPNTIQSGVVVNAGSCARLITYADLATPQQNVALRVKRICADGTLEGAQSPALPGQLIAMGTPSTGVHTRAEIVQLTRDSWLFAYALGNRPAVRIGRFSSPTVNSVAQDVLLHPRATATDAAGNIYVADTDNGRIRVYDRNGKFLFTFGSQGVINGRFDHPYGIAVDALGNIIVADTGNNRVQVFSPAGTFKFKFGAKGFLNGQFNFPAGVAVDTSGNIYIADTDNSRVQVFTSTGAFKFKFGQKGAALGQLNAPRGIAIGSNGRINVIERDNNRIQIFSSTGTPISIINSTLITYPRGIAIDQAGWIFVANSYTNRVLIFNPQGQLDSMFGTSGPNLGQFNDAASVAIDNAGRLLVVDCFNNRVQVFGCVP